MNISIYLHQVSISFQKYFNLQNANKTQRNNHFFNDENQEILKLKCQKAAQEISYLKKINHWPIANNKQKSSSSCPNQSPKIKLDEQTNKNHIGPIIVINCNLKSYTNKDIIGTPDQKPICQDKL